jgi:hypothetical protein
MSWLLDESGVKWTISSIKLEDMVRLYIMSNVMQNRNSNRQMPHKYLKAKCMRIHACGAAAERVERELRGV